MKSQRTKPAFPNAALAVGIAVQARTVRQHSCLPGMLLAREDKPACASALLIALDSDGGSRAKLAEACRVSETRVDQWLNASHEAAPNGVHARRAAAGGFPAFARAVGVEQLPAVVDEPEGVRTARTSKELADVLVIVTANLADGRRDGFERANERRELLELRVDIDRRLAVLDAEDAADAREREGLVKR